MMNAFKYVPATQYARHKVMWVMHNDKYIGYITVWIDKRVFYSVDGMISNLGLMKRACELYQKFI